MVIFVYYTCKNMEMYITLKGSPNITFLVKKIKSNSKIAKNRNKRHNKN